MEMIKTPVNGMRDVEPLEMELRQFILSKIREVYKKFGFTEIETPNVEHIENLLSDLGWDNEKLIFKIMKRGEKLISSSSTGNVNDLVDSGLRYDLTVPLCRFYANNKNKLNIPFKAMQIGNVYRADRPQKGRFRQFLQCDIDTIGEATNIGEIETLLATSTLLKEINFDKYDFSFDINDRRILRGIYKYANFENKIDNFDKICIILDKLDKIGFEGVKKELISEGYKEENINKLIEIFVLCEEAEKNFEANGIKNFDYELQLKKLKILKEKLGICLEDGIIENLVEIIETVSKNINVKINFNPTLVRGMGYYTGPIFEIKTKKFSGSVGGGGRYDKMIGKFSNVDVPALGISIGFERIIGIYLEDNYKIMTAVKKIAFLIEKSMDSEKKKNVIKEALEERSKGNIVYIAEMAKNKKFQKEKLFEMGYSEFKDFY